MAAKRKSTSRNAGRKSAARKRPGRKREARKSAARKRTAGKRGVRKAATKEASARTAAPRRIAEVSIEHAIGALFESEGKHGFFCVGKPVDDIGQLRKIRTGCCEAWARLQPPRLGHKMVELMEAIRRGELLDEAEKELIRAWPEHQLLAITRAIQSVCAVHGYVDPALAKKKRNGPPSVLLWITEPDHSLSEIDRKAAVVAVFQHADFKN